MREMLAVTSAIAGAGMIADVALITDGRFSGGSHGIVVGHMAPEAQAGGPIAAIQEGDIITIDLEPYIIRRSLLITPTLFILSVLVSSRCVSSRATQRDCVAPPGSARLSRFRRAIMRLRTPCTVSHRMHGDLQPWHPPCATAGM